MKSLKDLFGNLFTGSKGAGLVRLDLTDAGPAGRPRPAPPDPGMAARQEQPAPEAAYKKGDEIGDKYVVLKLLGRGGFGEVYLAYCIQTGGVYALKTFRQKFLADAEAQKNFKREALLWLNLEEHPCILAAHWVDLISDRLFVAMDYIAPDDRGRVNLADHLAHSRGPLDTDQVIMWAIMFCYGMEHANQRGIKCHRDIKPTNILIRQDGTLLISDFGLAAAAEAAWKVRNDSGEKSLEEGFVGLSLFQTEGKRVCGTPGYLAPEVFRGEGASVLSDIYSFGLVLWQMGAGSPMPPFVEGLAPPRNPCDIERFALEIYERQMRRRAPATGEPLEAVIERCLAGEPSKRFANFTQLRTELETMFHRRTGRIAKLPRVGERSWAFWNNKGNSLRTLGRIEEAVSCLRRAIEINPDFIGGHASLGLALQAKGDLDGAIAEYRTAIRMEPDAAQQYSDFVRTLRAKRDPDGNATKRPIYVTPPPSYAFVHSNLGLALKDKGDLNGAIAEFRIALRLEPDYVAAHYNLGLALYAKRDLGGAIAEYRSVIRLQPNHATAHSDLGLALYTKGDLDGAIAEYRTAISFDSRLAVAHSNLGAALYVEGDLDGAITEYRTTIRLQPDLVEAHYNLGLALKANGDLDGAIAEYRTAIRLQPDLASVHSDLGVALYAKRDVEGAIAEYRTAIRLRPDNANAHSNLGCALLAKGDLDGAITEWRTTLHLQPDHADAHHNLAVVLWMKGNL